MSPAAALKERVEFIVDKQPDLYSTERAPGRSTVLIATIDPAIRNGLTELLQPFSFNTIWLKSVEAAKRMLARERIAACLCGFWLQGGTYRELFRHIRRQRIDTRMIIASAPAWPNEYREYLAAINLGALDFLCYPYRKSDLERKLWWATERQMGLGRQQDSAINVELHANEAA